MSRMEPPDDCCWPAAPPPRSIELSKSFSWLLVPLPPPPKLSQDVVNSTHGLSLFAGCHRQCPVEGCYEGTTAGVQTFARHWAPVGSGYALIASTPTSRCEPVLHPWGALQLTAC